MQQERDICHCRHEPGQASDLIMRLKVHLLKKPLLAVPLTVGTRGLDDGPIRACPIFEL